MSAIEGRIFAVVMLVVTGAGVAYAAYYGLQSLKQSVALGETIPLSRLAQHVGEPVALSGRPERVDLGVDPFKNRCLWIKTSYQSWNRGWGGRRGWYTTHTETEGFDFWLSEGGASVVVRADEATEVHGTEGDSALGSFFSFNSGQGHRKLQRHLSIPARVTVCGKLVGDASGYAVIRDDEVGLLLTPLASGAQARREQLKGALGFVILPAAWILALLWFLKDLV